MWASADDQPGGRDSSTVARGSRAGCTAAEHLARLKPPCPGGDVCSWGSGEMGQLGFPLLEDLPRDQDGYPYEPTAGLIRAFRRMRICQIAGGDGHTAAVTVHGKLYSWGASACGQLGHSDTEHMPKDVEGYPYQPVPLLVDILQDVRIVQIACGDAHTIALSREGLLYSWGGGGCGQLGHSETAKMPKDEDGCPYQPAPRVVNHLRPHVVVTIACGKAHTIAVSDKGRMYTWGAGACGQLGHPDTSSFPSDEDGYPFQPVPREVEKLRDQKIVATACGDVHTLALTDEGFVYSFGGGSYGQLGMKDVGAMPVDADNCPYMPTPHRIAGLENIVKLACGDSHSLTADRDGRLLCWGANSCGQLGLMNPEDPRIRKDPDGIPHLPTPAVLQALLDQRIIDIACGEAHSLAVAASGNLYSWGACSCGQLGHGGCEGMPVDSDGYPYQPTPTLVTAGFQGKAVLKVACGGVHNLAVTESDQSLASALAELVNNELLADAYLKSSEGDTLPVHLCIFKSNAPKLYAYVAERIDEGGNMPMPLVTVDSGREVPIIDFSNVRMEVLADFAHYVYTLDVDAAASSLSSFAALLELYHLGSKFSLSALLPKCRRIIGQQLGKQALTRPRLATAAFGDGPLYGPSDGPWSSPPSDNELPPRADDVPAPQRPRTSGDGAGDGWGIFFLAGGQALVLDEATYKETLRRGTLLDLTDAEPPAPPGEDGKELEDKMRTLLNDESSTDVKLEVRRADGGVQEHVFAHKCVLACRSAYFRALFSSEFREKGQLNVPLDEITPEQLYSLMLFIYTDEWMVEDQEYAFEMIPIADRFSVLDLKRLCERTLVCTMSVEKVPRIFALADRYSCNRLRGRALLYMTDPRNFHAVMKTEAFAELDKMLILEVLQSHRMAPQPAPMPSEPLPGTSATASKPGQSKSSRDHRRGAGAGGLHGHGHAQTSVRVGQGSQAPGASASSSSSPPAAPGTSGMIISPGSGPSPPPPAPPVAAGDRPAPPQRSSVASGSGSGGVPSAGSATPPEELPPPAAGQPPLPAAAERGPSLSPTQSAAPVPPGGSQGSGVDSDFLA
eukprot:TRINITY_DN90783_c0_g1_i1.p1 TRINITY_DN90783_c0_g1~~TRINITY_DN90783_c0_g1_i1.p1  ORF type:complete len:1072 (-),score=190.99 TRINITY_DN90783_c0_g1_i1:127-3342(-)